MSMIPRSSAARLKCALPSAFSTRSLTFRPPPVFLQSKVRTKIDFVDDEDRPPSRTGHPDTILAGRPGAPGAEVPSEARNGPAPPCSYTPSEVAALAQHDCARRGQMCPAGGQTGRRGAPDPLHACGTEYVVGIQQEQVCPPPFPCTPLHRPGSQRPRAVQVLRRVASASPWA